MLKGYNYNNRNNISKFFKLKNNQWLKIEFSYHKKYNIWYETAIIADSKRQCNDCLNKSSNSSKRLYGKVTGNKLGLDGLKIALKELLNFEKTIHNTSISIIGANSRLNNIYKHYLIKYGYIEHDEVYNIKKFNVCTVSMDKEIH